MKCWFFLVRCWSILSNILSLWHWTSCCGFIPGELVAGMFRLFYEGIKVLRDGIWVLTFSQLLAFWIHTPCFALSSRHPHVFTEVVTGSIIPSDDILVVYSLIQLGWTDFVFITSLKNNKENSFSLAGSFTVWNDRKSFVRSVPQVQNNITKAVLCWLMTADGNYLISFMDKSIQV